MSDLETLKAERDRLKLILDAENSLHAFVKLAWSQIEGNKPFIDGWHIAAICEHLEACIRGEIKTLLVNCPPRMTKTNLISIMFPAWVWIKKPWAKFMYASYAQHISWEHSRICKMLIESPWYKQNWGELVQLSKDQSTKGHFANTALGYRIATSVGGSATGLGSDILVGDDINNAADGQSEVTREGVNDWIARVWSTRLNPGGLGVNIMTSQRVHEMDASGFWLSRDEDSNIIKLILPMEYESNRRCKTIILPSTNGKPWEDPRKKDGELLCEDYQDSKKIREHKLRLGSYNYAGQYQQRPSPESGGLIKRPWFQVWDKETLPKITYVIQSWDTALTANEDSAYSACSTWGLFKINNIVNVMLLTCFRARLQYVELVKRVERLYCNYLDINDYEIDPDYKRVPDRLLVEAKASGLPVVSDLVSKGIPATAFLPDEFGDKIQRVHLVTPFIECGRVWVCGEQGSNTLFEDHEMLIRECELFPKGDSRDVVDTLTQAFLYMTKKAKVLTHVMNPRF